MDGSNQQPSVLGSLIKAAGVALAAVLGAVLWVVLRIAAVVTREAMRTEPRAPVRPDRTSPLPRPGWGDPKPEHLVKPTYWPMVLALSIAFIFWGIISSLIISVIGLFFFILALANWIGELRHGP